MSYHPDNAMKFAEQEVQIEHACCEQDVFALLLMVDDDLAPNLAMFFLKYVKYLQIVVERDQLYGEPR